MNLKYLFSCTLLLNVSLSFSMLSNERFLMKIKPINNTDSAISVTGMTGRMPRIGEELPWRYENFGPKSEKKASNFGINGTMHIETAEAVFEVLCPREMPGWLFAFGTLKQTQEPLVAKKIQFSLSGKSKIKIIVNDTAVEFENLPRKEYVPRELKTRNQLAILIGN